MSNNGHWSQILPIVLVWCYIILFFCTNIQAYANAYDNIVAFLDTFLFVYSFLFYCSDGRKWTFWAKRSFLTVISLNILTELSYVVENQNYYFYYCLIITFYIVWLGIDAIKNYKNHKEHQPS